MDDDGGREGGCLADSRSINNNALLANLISISKYLVRSQERAHTEMQSMVSVFTAKDSQELASKNKKNYGVEW